MLNSNKCVLNKRICLEKYMTITISVDRSTIKSKYPTNTSNLMVCITENYNKSILLE